VDEAAVMESLRRRLASSEIHDSLSAIADELLAELRADPAAPKSTFRSIPLSFYGDGVPPDIQSAWVFVLRKGLDHPPERHPNSIQRMFALNRPGRFAVWDGRCWIGSPLSPGGAGLSIPADTWHRMPAQNEEWAVASFQTAKPHELIEIVGDPDSGAVASRRAYLAD
jgi:hypothetical protein